MEFKISSNLLGRAEVPKCNGIIACPHTFHIDYGRAFATLIEFVGY